MLRVFVFSRKLVDYRTESFRAESLLIVPDVLSPIMRVESEELLMDDELEELSVTVVDDSLVSVLVLEQAVARAIIERRKNADFAMFVYVKIS